MREFDRNAYRLGAQKAEANAAESNLARIATALERIATHFETNKLADGVHSAIENALFQDWQRRS